MNQTLIDYNKSLVNPNVASIYINATITHFVRLKDNAREKGSYYYARA